MRDYAPFFAAIAEADRQRAAAKAEWRAARSEMQKAAVAEALASLEALGVEIGKTVLTDLGRWDYQDRPMIIQSVTCWSSPLEAPGKWQLQAHYVRATNAGQPVKGAYHDWRNVVCAHPTEFGAALLARMPLWGDRRMRGHNATPRPEPRP